MPDNWTPGDGFVPSFNRQYELNSKTDLIGSAIFELEALRLKYDLAGYKRSVGPFADFGPVKRSISETLFDRSFGFTQTFQGARLFNGTLPSPVSEPVGLMGIGCLFLLLMRRRGAKLRFLKRS